MNITDTITHRVVVPFKVVLLLSLVCSAVLGVEYMIYRETESPLTTWTGECVLDGAEVITREVTLSLKCANGESITSTRPSIITAAITGSEKFLCVRSVGQQSERVYWSCAAPEPADD